MAGYTRQSTFADGDTITAALFNNEYNQLVNAFSNTTGHSHDGTAASGPVIGLIGDAGETSPNNKVLIDTTNNYIEFYVEVSSAPVQQLYIADGAIIPVTDSDVDLGTSSLYFKDAYIDSITTTGNVSVGGNLTVTGTTTFNGGTLTLGDAADDNVVFGADVNSNIIPNTDNTYDLGSSSQEWKDLYVDGIAYLDGINFNGTAITATAAELNILDGVTSTAAELNILDGVTATTAEINLLDGVTSTTAELNILDGVTATATEINLLDGVTSTTAELNILDGVTASAAEINLLDGVTATTAELNILDGVTSTATELNLLDGVTSTTAELNILDGVTSTTAELNLLDGVTATTAELNYVDVATAGTVEASKAIVVDSNKDFTGARNVTITGELDAATLDISGDADIDGTLEADAITIGGVTLAETISDTVGAMVSSNTETNITVTYDDTDNTLDFVIGTLNQDTTGNAATATALETARTIHGVSFDGTANIDLTEVVQDTVGAMFTSNTESGITVAYQDADGTVDFTVGTLNQDTTGNAATATALETARTIGGVSFDGTANIVPTTFNAATFSGDLNVDSGVLFADVSTNRVGINQTTPDVSLDLGANTDAMHVPVGTTAQRPASPAAGYFRYNTTTGGFEGYTDAWGAIAGSGGGTAPSLDTMTGDGSDTTLTLSTAPVNENATFVTIDGVLQHKDTYSISGNTLTFSEAPPSGSKVESITLTTTTSTTANILSDADADTKVQVEESSDEDKIRFDTGGTERMIIDSTGVGIGTASPSAPLDVAGNFIFKSPANTLYGNFDTTTAGYGAFRLQNQGSNYGFIGQTSSILASGGSNTALGLRSENEFAIATGGSTERMRIDSSGNLLLGTTSFNTGAFGSTRGINVAHTQPIVLLHETDTDKDSYIGMSASTMFIGTADAIPMRFSTNDTERMRIDSSGNVGIGTTSPSKKLHVHATGASEPLGLFQTTSTGDCAVRIEGIGGETYLEIANTSGTTGNTSNSWGIGCNDDTNLHIAYGTNGTMNKNSDNAQLFINSSTGNVGIGTESPSTLLHLSNASNPAIRVTDTTNSLNLEITATDTIGYVGTQSNHATAFITNNTERMRILSSGEVCIGKTSADLDTLGFHVVSGSVYSGIAPAANSYHLRDTTNNTWEFYVTGAGQINATSTSINALSDERLKENIVDLETGLDEVMALKPRRFDWKDKEEKNVAGFVAQEVETVLPDLIGDFMHDDLQDAKSVKMGNMIPTLVKAIQEQQAQIEALQSEINLLKGE